jgi:hypothetical protein
MEGVCLLDVTVAGGFFEIMVNLSDGSQTVIKVGSASTEEVMMHEIRELTKCLPEKGNARDKSGDSGEMYAIGIRSYKNGVMYAPTKKKVADKMSVVTSTVSTYFHDNFKSEYDDVQSALQKRMFNGVGLERMPGRLGDTMLLSKDLGNSAHYDTRDDTRGICIWIEEVPATATNWYFVLPDVSISGSRGVCIKLFHGAVLSWDGRLVRHCTSVTKFGKNNHTWACMFVSSSE